MNNTEVKDIIKARRIQLGLSYSDLGKLCGVDKTTAWKWELGKIENMRRDKMVLLSKALDISPLVLLGIEEYVSEGTTTYSNDKVSVYHEVFANKFGDVIGEINNPYSSETGRFFALEIEVKDEGMTGLLVDNKVYAIFKKQSMAENGAIVAVALADEKAMIKKYYHFEDVIVLRSPTSENENPITIVGDQVDEICILGKFVGMVSPFVD